MLPSAGGKEAFVIQHTEEVVCLEAGYKGKHSVVALETVLRAVFAIFSG